MFNLVQDVSAGSLEATPTFAMSILGLLCTKELVKDGGLSYRAVVSGIRHQKTEDVLTWILPRGYFTCSDAPGEHSLSLCILAHSWTFVAPSGLPVSIENDAKMAERT